MKAPPFFTRPLPQALKARPFGKDVAVGRQGNGRGRLKRHRATWNKSLHTDYHEGGPPVLKVKTFMSPLKIFHTVEELASLDEQVNGFIAGEEKIKEIVSVSDTCTTDNTGATIGVIRVVAYET
jgi:hypothetical protein